ncbi:DUF4215 domain-containing protein [Sorangium sp. So ce269]
MVGLLQVTAACGGDVSSPGAAGTESGSSSGSGSGGGPGSGGAGGEPEFTVGSGIGLTGGGGAGPDPCDVAEPPPECFLPPDPACGDGERNQESEACDDGNTLPGDGCSGQCQVEPYWECTTPGEPCVITIACGDGILHPGEFCDDGNTAGGDGCSADCYYVDSSHVCPRPGEPCILLYRCGDGRVNGSEECEDGDDPPASGDGCDAECKREEGYQCSRPGQPCTRLPVCGNSAKETGEGCDDGNTASGDGCSSLCRQEPYYYCPTPGSPCELLIECGDGEVQPGELCDDGNTADGDGCSADCQVRDPSYVCPEPGEPCLLLYRCGDGRVNGSEQCDDGEAVPDSGDGCTADCRLEEGWVCRPGQPCTRRTYCGDGAVQVGEQCDDGGGASPEGGDGCTAQCKIELGWTCPPGGGVCTPPPAPVCGDGVIGGAEVCDDGDRPPAGGDGCSADCRTIEPGWDCSRVGFPCKTVCGDGIRIGAEQCDDGDAFPGDGCDETCKIEPGRVCTDSRPQDCRGFSVCGDGEREGTEVCDDGNASWHDGCTPDCKREPACTGGACTSECGDGILLPGDAAEQCDDGNNESGDGCSAECTVEAGYVCSVAPNEMRLPMVIRDFIGWCPESYSTGTSNSACDANLTDTITGHFDFEISPSTGAQLDGTVQPTLDAEGKPVNAYGNPFVTPSADNGWTSGQNNFRWWYRDNPNYNRTLVTTIDMIEAGAGSGRFVYERNPFWPVDADPPGTDPALDSLVADGLERTRDAGHNFYFTSEVRYWFQFTPDTTASNNPVLTFYGDDDVWVFIKNTLTADIGGIHGRAEESVTILDTGDARVTPCDDAGCPTRAAYNVDLNLEAGKVYEIVVFQAERHVTGSNYQLTLAGFSAGTSVCTPQCGVNPPVVTPGEECDDGTDNGTGYGKCNNCQLGSYCGDGVRNGPEQCDNGVNNSMYANASGACAPGCVNPPRCGDGSVNAPYEACDLGAGNTASGYGGCTTSCEIGPSCGDGAVNGAEQCDDGRNDGFYGTCNPNCTRAPRCGDRSVDEEWGEECDDPADPNCVACQLGAHCGDAVVQASYGEECDDGINNGGYGECAPMCLYGPRCGDGVVQPDEEDCDLGEDDNTGAYNGCDERCSYGPYCGDAIISGPETCDDGVNDGFYGSCFPDCTPAAQCGDSNVDEEWGEQCDPPNEATGCSDNCRLGAQCGDAVVQANIGEQCDDGVNDGGYGECGPQCKYGPRCGDAVVNGEEQCDDGDGNNTGGYGKCAPGCVYGPYCGDGERQALYEECDDGNNRSGDGCSSACEYDSQPL